MDQEDSVRLFVPQQLYLPAESLNLAGELHVPALEFGPDAYVFNEAVSWKVRLTNTGDAILVQGTAEGTATTACGRCLEPCSFPFEAEVEGYFLIPGEEALDDDADGEFEVLPEDGVIDLEPLIVAGILVELPLVPLCAPDCLGLCPQCGTNLNEGACDCVPPEPFDEEKPNPFAALKDYQFE